MFFVLTRKEDMVMFLIVKVGRSSMTGMLSSMCKDMRMFDSWRSCKGPKSYNLLVERRLGNRLVIYLFLGSV